MASLPFLCAVNDWDSANNSSGVLAEDFAQFRLVLAVARQPGFLLHARLAFSLDHENLFSFFHLISLMLLPPWDLRSFQTVVITSAPAIFLALDVTTPLFSFLFFLIYLKHGRVLLKSHSAWFDYFGNTDANQALFLIRASHSRQLADHLIDDRVSLIWLFDCQISVQRPVSSVSCFRNKETIIRRFCPSKFQILYLLRCIAVHVIFCHIPMPSVCSMSQKYWLLLFVSNLVFAHNDLLSPLTSPRQTLFRVLFSIRSNLLV